MTLVKTNYAGDRHNNLPPRASGKSGQWQTVGVEISYVVTRTANQSVKTFDLLTLKVVFESCVTWATSVPILVFLGLSVLDLDPTYATDRRQTLSDVRRASLLNNQVGMFYIWYYYRCARHLACGRCVRPGKGKGRGGAGNLCTYVGPIAGIGRSAVAVTQSTQGQVLWGRRTLDWMWSLCRSTAESWCNSRVLCEQHDVIWRQIINAVNNNKYR